MFNVYGNTLASGSHVKSRNVFPSPYGMLSIGNGDPSGEAYKKFCKVINKDEAHSCEISQKLKFDPTCPMCGYELYLKRIAHVSPECRLLLDEELSCQALASFTASRYIVFYTNSEVKRRDTFLKHSVTGNKSYQCKTSFFLLKSY